MLSAIVPESLWEFTGDELKDAIKSFSELIGKGGFGCVYKGELGHVPIAIKVISPVSEFTMSCMIYYTA